MNIMAIEAGNLIDGMGAGVPVMKIKGRVDSMTLETNEGLGSGRKTFQIYQGFEVTSCIDAQFGVFLDQLAAQTFDGKAAGTMAGFTIHQRHAGFFSKLGPHGTGIKREFQFVMRVAGRETILGADIIGIEIADNHLLVFAYRQNRL